MVRIAAGRDSVLQAKEIAAEALAQFGQDAREPSIRSLAAALHVAPAAIYYHFPSQAAIYEAAVELVWADAVAETGRLVADPLASDPTDVLVAVGIGTRRAWLAHHRLSRYMAATPEANRFVRDALGMMANLFERLGLDGDEAAACFHCYSSFMIGAVLFAAARKTANDPLEPGSGSQGRTGFETPHTLGARLSSSDQTRGSIDAVMDLSTADPVHDEELFAQGLRRLINSFVTTPAG